MTMPPAPDASGLFHPGPHQPGVVRVVGGCIGVLLVSAVLLRVVDAVPGAIRGTPRGVKRLDSLESLERNSGWRAPVPAYFPSTLSWPPSDIRLLPGRAASLWFRRREDRSLWLILGAALDRMPAIAPDVLPAATSLQAEAARVGDHAALVERVRDADGATWHQITWRVAGRIRLARCRGTLDDVMRIASSLDE